MAASQANLDYVQKMFVAYLGRASSASAQETYAALIDADEAAGKAVLFDGLYSSAEGQALYAGKTEDAIITQMFQNMFGRDPGFSGLTYYYNGLQAGTFNILEAAAIIADSADAAGAATLAAKQTAADKMTVELGADQAKIDAYGANASEARESLAKVTDATSAASYDAAAEYAAVSGGNQIGGSFTLTTDQDIPSMTADNDTVTGAQTTYGAADVIADASATDADVMTVTATADITATPTVSGVETINFNLDSFTAAGGNAANFEVAADNIANGNINVNVTKAGSSIATGVVTGLATGSNVTFGSAIVTAATATGADNAALTVTSGAATITADSGGTLTGATMTGTGAATTTTTFVSDTDAALTATTTLSDMTVTAAAAKTVNLTSAKDIDANTTDLTAATSVNLTAGNEVTVGLDAATVATVSAGGTTNSVIDDAAGDTLTTLNLSGNGSAHTFNASNSEGVKTVTMTGDQDVTMIVTAAAVDGLTNNQLTVTDSTTAGTTTVDLTGNGAVDTSTIGADVIEISTGNTSTILMGSGQSLTVSADQAAFAVDGTDAGAASNTATLILNDGVATANATVDITGGLTLTDLSTVTIDVSKDSFTTTGFTASAITGITGSADNTSVTINAGANGVTLAGGVDLSGATGGGALVINSDGAVGLGTTAFDVASLTHVGSGAVTATATSTEVNAVTTGSGVDSLTFDGLADSLTVNTGGGNDSVVIGAASAATKTYAIDLGDGATDTVTISGNRDLNDGTSFTLANTEILNFANATTAVTVGSGLLSGASYLMKHATAANTLTITAELGSTDTSADFSTLVVDGASLTSADSITLDGSAKTVALTLTGIDTMANTLSGGTKGDAITGGDAGDTLSGNAGADIISGGAGNDTITGGNGADTLNGGTGDNTYVYGGGDADSGETITLNTTTGATETIKATGNVDISAVNAGALLTGLDALTIDDGVNGATLTMAGAQVTGLTVAVTGVAAGGTETAVISGTAQDDTITIADFSATNAVLQLDGGDGDDTLTGDANGASTINGGAGADTITGGSAADIITGGDGADIISAAAGADIITGGDDNDVITLSADTDVDTVIFESAAAGNGSDTITAAESGTAGDILDFDAFLGTIGVLKGLGAAAAEDAVLTAVTAGAEAEGTNIADKVFLMDTDDFADVAAIQTAIVDSTDDDKLYIADGAKAVILHGDVADGAQTFNIYYVVGTAGGGADTESLTLVGTVAFDDGDAINFNSFA